jgi:predicted nucleic acid-binding Zn ribbon protein
MIVRDSDDDHDADDWDDDDDTEECPHCGASIYDDSERCFRCGTYLSSEDISRRRHPWWVVAGVIACLAMVSWWVVNFY